MRDVGQEECTAHHRISERVDEKAGVSWLRKKSVTPGTTEVYGI